MISFIESKINGEQSSQKRKNGKEIPGIEGCLCPCCATYDQCRRLCSPYRLELKTANAGANPRERRLNKGKEQGFCLGGKSGCINLECECRCGDCPVAKRMGFRYMYYCIAGSHADLLRTENVMNIRKT